jgi:hypothetical protein
LPLVLNAQATFSAVLIAVKVTPAGIVTATGMLLSVVLPLPNFPNWLFPQQYAIFVLVSAHAKSYPACIDVKVTPVGIVTATGTVLLVVLPLPS